MSKRSHKTNSMINVCVLCGLSKCKESIDHEFTTLADLELFVTKCKVYNPVLDKLSLQVHLFYSNLLTKITEQLQKDQDQLQKHISRLFFPQLVNCDMQLLSQICIGKLNSLPSKKILKLIKGLQSSMSKCLPVMQTSNTFSSQVLQYFSQFNQMQEVRNFYATLPFSHLSKDLSLQTPSVKLFPEVLNPEELPILAHTYKNVQLKEKNNSIQLSNKNITDQEFIREIGILSSFSAEQFCFRNNKISPLSCKIMACNLQHIKRMDVRGNCIGDKGILALVTHMKNLKGLMISQTGCTNISIQAVLELEDLEKLWCENNGGVDGTHIMQIIGMPKIRMISFAGCNIDAGIRESAKLIFHPKGFIDI